MSERSPSTRSRGHARWCAHVNGVNAPPEMRHWLTDPASLTAKLIARSRQFRVRRLHQQQALCLADEFAMIELARRSRVWEREVLLQCDGQPMIFAHTVVPLTATAAQWPLFGGLGERSLGTTLFTDPKVLRGDLQFARLQPEHPMMRRMAHGTRQQGLANALPHTALYARRSLFRRNGGVMLVTEIFFLPGIAGLELVRR
ncbi:chorismate--pyruvate lyase family protein [Undibacterium arcticum]